MVRDARLAIHRTDERSIREKGIVIMLRTWAMKKKMEPILLHRSIIRTRAIT